MAIIETKNLTKKYADFTAVSDNDSGMYIFLFM